MAKGEVSDEECRDGWIVVPPFLKYAAGPLLGPAVLQGASESQGLNIHTADFNIAFIHSVGALAREEAGPLHFYGDHSKPSGLESVEWHFWENLMMGFPRTSGVTLAHLKKGWYSHAQVNEALELLSDSPLGLFVRRSLGELPRTRLMGISVLWAGQVLPGLMVSKIVKTEWPNARVVWGGAHVTAIIDEIMRDANFGTWVDGFLAGHCEESFVRLVASMSKDRFECPGLVIPGQGTPTRGVAAMIPPPDSSFPDLTQYGHPKLTLPIELSVGCPYARCSFCTYPAIEGEYLRFPLDSLRPLINLAEKESAAISFKDSLVPAAILRGISCAINGRVEWSACTKLAPNLDSELLSLIARKGCRTLEVGLESLNAETQERIDKIQPMNLLDHFLEAASSAGISVVLNYMTGFPWEDSRQADALLQELKDRLGRYRGLIARVEHNRFNLERLSPMAIQPEKYSLEITGMWPWSSILDWKPIPQNVKSSYQALLSSGSECEKQHYIICRAEMVAEGIENSMGSIDAAGLKGA